MKWFRYNTFKAFTILSLVVFDQAIPTLCHMTIHWIDSAHSFCPAFWHCSIPLLHRTSTSGISITTRVKNSDIHHYYFNIIGTIPGQDYHSIWGSLHFLPLALNVFLPCYDSGTFSSHPAEGEYGFDILGLNCIDMYQMYMVVPTVHGDIPYVGVGLVY